MNTIVNNVEKTFTEFRVNQMGKSVFALWNLFYAGFMPSHLYHRVLPSFVPTWFLRFLSFSESMERRLHPAASSRPCTSPSLRARPQLSRLALPPETPRNA